MDSSTLVKDIKVKLDQALEKFKDNLKTIRTGRANPSMLDAVTVEAYGTTMPLKQVGSVVAPEAQLLQITPFDPGNLSAIADAIRKDSSLGFNPVDDGRVVRISIPPLTEERRKELAKNVSQKHEEFMISIRNIRHDAINSLDKSKKDKEISEDEQHRLVSQVEEEINKIKTESDTVAADKEKEIISL